MNNLISSLFLGDKEIQGRKAKLKAVDKLTLKKGRNQIIFNLEYMLEAFKEEVLN